MAAAIAGVAFLFAVGAWFGSAAAEVTLGFEPIAAGLALPVGLAHAGDGSGRLFIVQQAGRVLIHTGTQILPTPFLDIGSLISCCGEQGLLGLAFHPHFAQNGFFYVSYTDPTGAIVLARYHVSGDPNVADPASGQVVLTFTHPFANHNAGQLAFGPDSFLYMSSGDGGSGGDPDNHAQSLGDLLGKLLRLDVDGAFPYAIPPTNPFRNTPNARPEIWAFGLRNPWRFSFDRQTGDLFIADVGQGQREELNVQPAGSPGGENYGWHRMEGTLCFDPATNCNDGSLTLTLPVLDYDHSLGCSIIGGYRYRGARFPQLVGHYFYGDYCSGRIWTAEPNQIPPLWTGTQLLDTTLNITAFGEDEAGEVYVVHYGSGTNGTVQRLIETSQSFLVTVNRAGTGTGTVVSSPPGILCGGTCSALFGNGATVTLSATPNVGSVFAGWSGGGGCGGTGQCAVTNAVTVTATFTTQNFTLSVGIVGSGSVASNPAGIACPSTCAAVYPANLVVALTATPSADSIFADWSGGGCSGTGTCNVTLGADTTVTATFSTMATLSITVTGPGTVTSQPPGIACPPTCSANFQIGVTVTLAAVAGARATFSGWSGDCAGTTFCSLAMTAVRMVGATFVTSFSGTFTDDPLTVGMTLVKAVHVTELRLAIDQERTRRGLALFAWTTPVLTPGVTVVAAMHLIELRTALNAAYQAASRTPPAYTDVAVTPRALPVRAVHIHELRAAVRVLQGS